MDKRDTEKKQLILIVDDDVMTRYICREALEEADFAVEEAGDGKEAIEIFKVSKPDMVILDINMPQLNGFETCISLRKMKSGEHIPILMFTTDDDIQSIKRAYEVGATDFTVKPINPLIISQRVRYMLRASRAFNQLSKNEAILANAQRIARVGSWELDIENNVFICTDETLRIYGMKGKPYKDYKDFLDTVHPDEYEKMTKLMNRAINYGIPFHADHQILLPDNKERHVSQNVEIAYDENSKAVRIIGTIQDITERKQIENFEADRNRVLEMIVVNKSFKDTLMQVLRIIQNQKPDALCAVFLLQSNKLYLEAGTKLSEPFVKDFREMRIGPNEACCGTAAYFGNTVIASDIENSPFWNNYREVARTHKIRASASMPIFSGQGQMLGTIDIYYQKLYEPDSFDLKLIEVASKLAAVAIDRYKLIEELKHQAQHDALTGLPNRMLLDDRLSNGIERASRYNERLGVIYIDLDRFKYVNDSYGHQVGDKLIKLVAERIKNFMRKSDTLARMGGDEFILLLNKTNPQGITKVASAILKMLTMPFNIEDYELHIGASIGISIYPDNGHNVQILKQSADIAMYHSKNKGGCQFSFFSKEMNEAVVERLELENELRKAIELNQLELHYQPQYDLSVKKLIGLEALLRWTHHKLGFISPGKFIPIAEESGLIIPIGKWVLQEACRQNAEWQRQGYDPVRVAVNVSIVQLMQTDFVSTVVDAIEQSGLEPQWLEIEVTESMLMTDKNKIIKSLEKVKALGVSIAIDDFGTGYSSMAYLQDLPIDCLKIDRSFLININYPIDASNQAQALMRTFVSLTRNLGLTLVAEGLENQEQHQFLCEIGCDIGQGFYLNGPMKAQLILNHLTRSSIQIVEAVK